MSLRFTQVDAFTREPFRGNPAAVFVLDAPLADEQMQLIAREMNLSETAFVVRGDAGVFDLRWFTPVVEMDLCGHATLAAAHALWEDGVLDAGAEARFDTRSGRLTCRPDDDGAIAMDFPVDAPSMASLPPAVAAVLPDASWTGRGRAFHVARLEAPGLVRSWTPDLDAIASLDSTGLIITAAGNGDVDAVSRVFLPQLGIPEDPVTGAAHCTLGPLWAAWLDRDEVRCEQASVRGGELVVRVRDDRVDLVGHAVTVIEGTLRT